MSDPVSAKTAGVPEGAVGISDGDFVVPGSTPLFREDDPVLDEEGNEALDLDLNVDVDQAPADNLADLDEENQYGNL